MTGIASTDMFHRGVPVIKSTTDPKAEALAKARAIVEEENAKSATKQETADNVESTEQDGKVQAKTEAGNTMEQSIKDDVEATAGKKRDRDEGDSGDAEREIKKVDTKEETVA